MLRASASDNLVSYSFDFGSNGVEEGYIGVSASDAYNSDKGYGFNKVYYYHMISSSETSTDKTHFTEAGAYNAAKIIADALVEYIK